MLGTVELDGVTLRYRVDGEAGAPWVVLGNSLATDLSIWEAQARALAPAYRVLRYDQRGHGESGLGTAPARIEVLAGDLKALLEALEIGRCTYVGLSMGVPTGLAALRLGAKFERLVFVDGQPLSAATGAEYWSERIAFVRAHGMERFAEATAERWLGGEAVGDARGERLRRIIAATPEEGLVYGASCLKQYDFSDVLAGLDLPLLALAGAEDGAMPERMKACFGPLETARVEVLEGAGHVPNFETPEAFNQRLLTFLGDTA
jgi:3-oxoadipate enol-lactonase